MESEPALEAAIAKANEMREKKIASLKKQIKKLEGMKFEPLGEMKCKEMNFIKFQGNH